jgi:hypothetical protein
MDVADSAPESTGQLQLVLQAELTYMDVAEVQQLSYSRANNFTGGAVASQPG